MTDSRLASDLGALARDPGPHPGLRISSMAQGLVGSEILRISAEIRARTAGGGEVCDLTVGDFSPRQFPIPARLREGIHAALDRGETNYPPANGLNELRQAVARFYARELGLEYPAESVLVAGGARPIVYCLFRALCDPGDVVVYPVPSWNNNHYTYLVGAVARVVPCGPERRFMPRREEIIPLLPGARLLCLNTPLNPAGTVLDRDELLAITEAVVAENDSRAHRGERPLYVMYDHIYWMLRFAGADHATPPGLVPEAARYSVFVDGISKAFAATGLRVGWGVGPLDVIGRMSALLGHVGAWAPRPEQIATVALLDDPAAIREYRESFTAGVMARLSALHEGLQDMKRRGLPVDSMSPQGAMYLAARVHPFGRRTPTGSVLRTNEEVRHFLLEEAGVGGVPFQAFGAVADDGWFRLSAGAVGVEEIAAALPRLETALRKLS
jgi:aspartate aminotransferase